jgi:hypothetical protein
VHCADSKWNVGFEILTDVTMKRAAFVVVTVCSAVKVHRRFGGTTYCLNFQGRRVQASGNHSDLLLALAGRSLILHFNPEDGDNGSSEKSENVLLHGVISPKTVLFKCNVYGFLFNKDCRQR